MSLCSIEMSVLADGLPSSATQHAVVEQGRMSEWLRDVVGVDPRGLHPSVRFGLEGALLSALAEHRGGSLAAVLGPPCLDVGKHSQGHDFHGDAAVHVNGLLDCSDGPREVAADAARLVHTGFKALKIKVCRACSMFSRDPCTI